MVRSRPRKNFATAMVLSIFFGGLGIDRFYLGCIFTGILKLITFGGLGIWYLIDMIRLATGSKLCGGFKWSEFIPAGRNTSSFKKRYSYRRRSSHQYGGGEDEQNNDTIIIIVALALAGVVFYYYVYPWLQEKGYFSSNKEQDKEPEQDNDSNNQINNIGN